MRFLISEEITSSVLTASNVATTDHAAWLIGTTYNLGDRVVVLGTVNKIYESTSASNTGNNPVGNDGTRWIEVSAINRYKAFDGSVNSSTVRAGTITYTLAPTRYVTALSFFRLSGQTLRVVVKDATSATRFDRTIALLDDTSIRTFYDYVDPLPQLKSVVVDATEAGVPLVAIPTWTIEITIDAGANEASVGVIQIGRRVDVGDSTIATSVGFKDFSRLDFDDFGKVTLVRRNAKRDLMPTVAVQTTGMGQIMDLLENQRGTITTFWTHDNFGQFGTGIIGVLRNFTPSYTGGDISFLTVEIQGIT